MKSLPNSVSRALHAALLALAVFAFIGAGDDGGPRFNDLGHRLMCVCGCNQILLECNHVGCTYSERMRGELMTRSWLATERLRAKSGDSPLCPLGGTTERASQRHLRMLRRAGTDPARVYSPMTMKAPLEQPDVP